MARETVDLSAVVSSVAEQIEPVVASRSLVLTCDIPPGVMVEGDSGWLERLLLILLDNGIKFTPEGGLISISLALAGGEARMSIADSGIGIPPASMPRLFERFYRADSSRSRQTEGAGLGLALAKWIAERHGGRIEVKSAHGAGTTFTVSLRAIAVKPPANASVLAG
jgi:signal transduction histidine kinase